MNLRQAQFIITLIAVIIFNVILFSLAEFKKYKQKYKTFYSCEQNGNSKVYNGLEFKMYKIKFQKLNKMSPQCKKLK